MTGSGISQHADCLVIGAGISGLMAAKVLSKSGIDVLVLDKGRGAGGRMATRRLNSHRFDHGAQAVFCTTDRLAAAAREWQLEQVVHPCEYPPISSTAEMKFGPVCGVKGMSSIAKHLASNLRVRTGFRVTRVSHVGLSWHVRGVDDGGVNADSIILTAPVPQAIDLLDHGGVSLTSDLGAHLSEIAYEPCVAVMTLFDTPHPVLESTFVRPPKGPISLIVDNYAKGVSPAPGAITIHTTAEFALHHWDEDDADILALVHQAAEEHLPTKSLISQVHRWRYSRCVKSRPEPHLLIKEPGLLAFAGDGFGRKDIEGAALSGISAANAILSNTA